MLLELHFENHQVFLLGVQYSSPKFMHMPLENVPLRDHKTQTCKLL